MFSSLVSSSGMAIGLPFTLVGLSLAGVYRSLLA